MGVTAKRAARIELTAGTAGMDRGLDDAKRKLRTFEREQARAAKQAEREARQRAKAEEKARARLGRRAQTLGGGVVQGFGQALGIDAVSGAQSIASGVIDYERALTRLQIASESSPTAMRAFSDEVRKASDATGVNKKDVLGAATAYVTLTGDMNTARAEADLFAKAAQATGSNVDDLAKMAAAGAQNLGLQASEFEAFFSGMTAQGKAGAIELKDLAAELSTIAPQWAQFAGGKGLQGARQLGAAMQVIKKGFGGDSGETTAGLQNFLTAIQKKGDRFKDAGVGSFFEVKNGKRDLKDVFTIVDQISKKKLDKDQLIAAFGSIEAYRAFIQLRDNRAELERIAKAGQDAGMIQRDFDTYMASSAGRTEQSWTKVKNAVAAAFTPERIEAFASAIEGISNKIAPIANAVGKIGDVLGGIHKAGQDMRGFVTGENRITMMDRVRAKGGDHAAIAKIDNIKSSAHYATIRAADSQMAREKMGIKAGSSIELARQYSEATGDGAVAKRAAAERYFATTKQIADPWSARDGGAPGGAASEMSRDGMKGVAQEIARSIRKELVGAFDGIGIKIGGEAIQKAGANSIKHRGGR